MDDTALAHARHTAARLLRVMETHEAALARAAEARLFPGGAPARVTFASLMRALIGTLMAAAHDMAESDAAYNAMLREHRGQSASSGSLLSQDVAEKIALSVELEEIVLAHADDAGARLERKLFPDGLPEQIGLLGIFQALRRRIALAAAPGGQATVDIDVDIGEILGSEMPSMAQLFVQLSEICGLREPGRAIRAFLDLDAIDDPSGE